jgi:hypothetical protein
LSAQWRCICFFALVISAGMLRAMLASTVGDVPPGFYVADPAKIFDFGLDGVVAAVGLVGGIMFYVPTTGGTLQKPGQTAVVSGIDVAVCAFVSTLALVVVVAVPPLAHQFQPEGLTKAVIMVGIPDIVSLAALGLAVIRLT